MPTCPMTVCNTHQPRPRLHVPGHQSNHGYVDDSYSSDSECSQPDDAVRTTYVPPCSHPRTDIWESVSGYVADQGPLLKPFNLNPGTWKEEDKLTLEKGNYQLWAKKVYANISLHSGAMHWLDPNKLCPSFEMYLCAHRTWQNVMSHPGSAFSRDTFIWIQMHLSGMGLS
ncbi:hypothetical protein DFH08DRAFT_969224 [Mycena albidolilacea]|uniref:Uncharacterized protein n=1 Tax=Mycena albidolilacea TaxID=1033008 RepID=A0AAD6ZIS8_9AGAR|nr:hypothetical protein DFH08DRAFT_969224 [Mycena albidolilacea]